MRLLADENVHALVVAGLRDRGFAVEWVARTTSSHEDAAILARPDIGRWILLTYDRDFGELIFRHGMPTPRAVLYSRLDRLDPEANIERIVTALRRRPLEGHLIVLDAVGDRHKSFVEEETWLTMISTSW